jgi:tetratricopeptide (TPR) repeat protein
LADIYRQSGNDKAALAEAQALAGVDNAAAQISRGRILLTLGRAEEALAAFDRALSYEKDPMTYVYRAQALPAADKLGRRREADAALQLNPSDGPSLGALAQILSQLGDHGRALQLLDQAFLRSPDDLNVRHARAVEMLLAGKADAANRELDAISAKELSAVELNNMCWSKALANVALDRALAECDRSLAKEDRPATHDSKATVLLRQSRFDEAIKEYDIAMKDGEFAAPLYGRSIAYARKGDRAKADADVAKALHMAPGIDRTYSQYGIMR